MERPTRRQVLATAGGGLALALPGCSDGDDPAPGLHAVTAVVLHRPGDSRYRFPEDAAVRAAVENTDTSRHSGTLVVELERTTGEDETWSDEREIELPGGTTRNYHFVFEDVSTSEDAEFEAAARIEDEA